MATNSFNDVKYFDNIAKTSKSKNFQLANSTRRKKQDQRCSSPVMSRRSSHKQRKKVYAKQTQSNAWLEANRNVYKKLGPSIESELQERTDNLFGARLESGTRK